MEAMKWGDFYPMVVVPGGELNQTEDVRIFDSLFLDATHSVPPRHPLFSYYATKYWAHGMKYGAENISLPSCRGYEWRHFRGGMYCTCLIVKDEDERKKREEEFRKRMEPYLRDFGDIWEERKKELIQGSEEIRALDMDNAPRSDVVSWLYRNRMLYARMWEIHFEMLEVCFTTVLLLSEVTKQRFGVSLTSPEFQKLIRGIDNKAFRVHETLWEYAQRAVDEGLEDIFKEHDPKSIMTKMKESQAGKRWAEDFMKFLEVDGWWPIELMEFSEPYWLEEPSIPIGMIKQFIEKGVEYKLPEIRNKLAKEREETKAELLRRLPEGMEREYFEKLHKVACVASALSEEHDIYCEYAYHAVLRYQYMRLGKRLSECGTIESREDILFMNPEEIEAVVMVPELNDMRPLVQARRRLFAEWKKEPNPPVISNKSGVEEAVQQDLLPGREPIIMSVVVGELPEVKPELRADIYGVCGASGEAEGTARVISKFEELDEVQEGDILVAVNVNVDWVSVFNRIKGVVTDRGGVLSHGAILSREFSLPAVVNTFVATERIKTGDRVRLQADDGAIFVNG